MRDCNHSEDSSYIVGSLQLGWVVSRPSITAINIPNSFSLPA